MLSALAVVSDVANNMTTWIPDVADFDLDMGESANFIGDGYNDMYDDGNYLSTNFASQFNYSENNIKTNGAFGTEGFYVTKKSTNLWMLAANMDDVTDFRISGETGSDGDGISNASGAIVTVGQKEYMIFTKTNVESPDEVDSDASINHLIIIPFNSQVRRSIDDDTDSDFHQLTNLEDTKELYYFLFTTDNGYTVPDSTFETMASYFLTELQEDSDAAITVAQTEGLSSGSLFPMGTTTNTYEYTDRAGNTSTCSFDVIVEDTFAPTVLTNDITVSLDDNGEVTITPDMIDGGSFDSCSIELSIDRANFGCDTLGGNTVTLTATDGSNNEATSTAIVTVVDDIAPTVNVKDITVELDENGQVFITPDMINDGSTDNCEIASLNLDVSILDCSSVGTNEVLLSVTDSFGNSSTATATVTVVDSIDPVAVARDISVELDENGQVIITAEMVGGDSYDNCGIESMSLDKTSFDCDAVGDHMVTLTVKDFNGNQAISTATITIEDETAPQIISQNITVSLGMNGQTTITPDMIDNGSTDNCGIDNMVVIPSTFGCSNIGVNTVIFIVGDKSGNQRFGTALVTVQDTQDPVAKGKDLTVALDANGTARITPRMIDDGSTDNCGISSMTLDVLDFDCSSLGDNEVTLTVIDNAGNEKSIKRIVTIVDDAAPVILQCPEDVVLEPSDEDTYIMEDFYSDLDIDDNCASNLTIIQSPAVGTEITRGFVPVTITVTDDSGNSTQCRFFITTTLSTGSVDKTQLRLYPNPTQNIVTITKTGDVKITTVEVYDLAGRQLESIAVDQVTNDIRIDLSAYPTATYLLRIKGENGLDTYERVIKK